MILDNDMRRAIGLAVQILEDMPEWLQPKSNMHDMRELLEGRSTGRDGLIIAQSIATAIVYRTSEIIEGRPITPDNPAVFNNRMHELAALFEVVKRIDVWAFTNFYLAICDTLTRTRLEDNRK